MRKYISVILLFAMLLTFTGCHGSQEAKVFEIPETFDTSRQFEISFINGQGNLQKTFGLSHGNDLRSSGRAADSI